MIDLELIFDLEGGYSNDKNDPGGPTMYGIIEKVYHRYLKNEGLPLKDVRDITDFEVHKIYEQLYWDPMHLDLLNKDKAVFMFQFGINCGVNKAIMLVQDCLGLKVDGILGPKTAKAINEAPIATLVNVQKSRYDVVIAGNEKLECFRVGWGNRIKRTLQYIHDKKLDA